MTQDSIRKIEIRHLGEQTFDSKLATGVFLPSETKLLHVPIGFAEDAPEKRDFLFEAAGPRPKLFFNPNKTRIAIVTCGGLCPGLNDVIRSIVLESYFGYGVTEAYGIRHGLSGFISKNGFEPIKLTPDVVNNIHRFGGTILGSSRGVQDMCEIVDFLQRHSINILYVIGGDGSMRAAKAIEQECQKRNALIAVVGIPKTIDNDINFVPQSFGFDTAVEKACEAVECAHVEATGCPNTIGLVKLMGRESGFIASQTALSSRDVNYVLVPELKFALEGPNGFLPILYERIQQRGHAVIVAAEGAGQYLLEGTGRHDASGNVVLSDIGHFLKRRIEEYFKLKGSAINIKYIDPSYIIRSIPANKNDACYCGMLGQYAVHAGMAGRSGLIISRIMGEFVHVPLELVTSKRRHMDPLSEMWRCVLESTGQWNIEGMRG